MNYRRLGKAGVKVSALCFGAGVRGLLDEARFVRSLERAIELGCSFINCANNYGKGQSETILRKVIKGRCLNRALSMGETMEVDVYQLYTMPAAY